jgi:RNA polymerase sigma-70 factor, ECF subfamily
MACAGTLSWSVAGLAGITSAGKGSLRGTLSPVAPSRRKGQPTNHRAQGVSGSTPRKLDQSPRQPVPNQAPAGKGKTMSPDDRGASATTREVRLLEIDWSEVVRRCMAGDSGAWAELVRSHHRRVYALCYRFTGNGADAEDLTQDVFLKIYSNLSSFDIARGSLQVWITTMTRNLLVDNFRRTRNQRATDSLDAGWDETDELRPIDRLQAGGASPHDRAAQKELAKMVQGALARVSVELREAVILRDLQDMDYKEIAQVLGIPEGTVKSRISRGRAELARLLERNKREVM